jgi:hypothetical protein
MKYIGKFHRFVPKLKEHGAASGALDFLAVGDSHIAVIEWSIADERLAQWTHVRGTTAVDASVRGMGSSGALDPTEATVGNGVGHVGDADAAGRDLASRPGDK